MLRRLIETLILPPMSAFVLAVAGTVLVRWRRKLGRGLQIAAFAWLWLAATPCIGGLLLHSLQSYPALAPQGPLPAAQAIVVLSAGADRVGREYGGAVIGPMTMRRLRYAVHLHKRTGLPLLVSGGLPARNAPSLAAMMQQAAEREFGVEVQFCEERSADTRGNARFSAAMLKEQGIETILLVTSAWHMPRSVNSFESQGMTVVAAPTGFRDELFASWTSFVPHWTGLRDTCLAMHEWGGRVIYALRD